MADYITEDGEVVEVKELANLNDTSIATAFARTELESQSATARQHPRSIRNSINNILSMATLDEETAMECIYALRRGGKPIRGPSIRLAEICATFWGNCRDTATVVTIDRVNKLVIADGSFLDLETNRLTKSSVPRRISDKYGKIYNDDMIAMTGNAACSIARRNAILAGIPKGVWRKAVEACEQIIRGDAKTMVERRDAAIKALAHFNLSPDHVFKIMDVGGVDDISLDDLATLRVIYANLKNGEQTVEELLRSIAPDKRERVTASTASTAAPAQFADDVPTADDEVPAKQVVEPVTEQVVINPQPTETAVEQVEPEADKQPDTAPSSEPNDVMAEILGHITRAPDGTQLTDVLVQYATDITGLDPSRRRMVDQLVTKRRRTFKRG